MTLMLLIIVAIVANIIGYFYIKPAYLRWVFKIDKKPKSPNLYESITQGNAQSVELVCAKCGTQISSLSSIKHDQFSFCCLDHRDAFVSALESRATR